MHLCTQCQSYLFLLNEHEPNLGCTQLTLPGEIPLLLYTVAHMPVCGRYVSHLFMHTSFLSTHHNGQYWYGYNNVQTSS